MVVGALGAVVLSLVLVQRQTPPVEFTLNPQLALEARLLTPLRTQAWWPIEVEIHIKNLSETETCPYILPGDGSSAGWREPWVGHRLKALGENGLWVQSPVGVRGGCGNYDAEWRDEIRFLAAGERRRLHSQWLRGPMPADSGVCASFFYRYSATPSRLSQWDETPLPAHVALGAMGGVPPFEIVSEPLYIETLAPEASREEYEQALELCVVSPSGPKPSALDPIQLKGTITNRSATRSFRVVPPLLSTNSYGSHPKAQLTALAVHAETTWLNEHRTRPTPRRRARTEPDWRPTTLLLKPGEFLEFDLPDAHDLVRFGERSRASFQLTYNFNAHPLQVDVANRKPFRPEDLGDMRNVPPFRLQSQPLTVRVRHPLEVSFRLKKQRGYGGRRLVDHFEIEITNRSEEPFELSTREDPCQIASLHVSGRSMIPKPVDFTHEVTLQPGETLKCMETGTIGKHIPEFYPLGPGNKLRDRLRCSIARTSWKEDLRAEVIIE